MGRDVVCKYGCLWPDDDIVRKPRKIKVFLGGTCNESNWRDELIPMLKVEYFNPVVEDWTPACQEEEIKQRRRSDYVLYVITPRMAGVYSIAEAVDDSNKRPSRTLFCVIDDVDDNGYIISFTKAQWKSLNMVGKMIQTNGGKEFNSLKEVANFLNSKI